MAALEIYGTPQSRTFRTLWMAKELGIPFESKPLSLSAGETRSDAYRKINPNCKIPAIDDDGFRLYESMAINLYLVEKHGGPLQPASAEDRALTLQWSFWAIAEVEKAALAALFHRLLHPEDKRDEAVALENIETLQKPFAVLDGALAGREYLLGGDFTVADLNVAAVMAWARMAKADFSGFPNLSAWLERCLKRPAAQR